MNASTNTGMAWATFNVPGSRRSAPNCLVKSNSIAVGAKLATLYGKGEMKVGDTFVYESILCTKFKGEIVEEAEVGGYKAIIPRVTGSAYVTGYNSFLVDPKDSLKDGFLLG